MGNMRTAFEGKIEDIKGRSALYKQDWTNGLRSVFRILAPTFYIFFASALLVIAFGEQLSRDTDDALGAVETLTSATSCGIIHSILGGQPLLIVDVAEPTIIMYTYLYHFCKQRPDFGQKLFLAWNAWVCVWTAMLLILLAIFNECTIITRFTRIAGEGLGILITVLFLQEAIKGAISEFHVPKALSYMIPGQVSSGVPRRLFRPQLWDLETVHHWTVIKDMGKVPIIVASQMAQQKEFNLKIPSAYHYDILLLGVMTLICRLLGLPPSYGVLPQFPMHTKSLAVLKKQPPREPVLGKVVATVQHPSWRYKVLEGVHAPYLETVPFKSILMFTLFQLVYFVACYAVTWFPTARILFLMPFFLLISIRQYILPKLFPPECLRELDAAEYKEIVGKP
ncbi:hypothetical protein GOBAR_AA28547 [Gossypium barbadense]|uniref:Bicarbonate transporter-like transmembrane domain-containing protein n=1 Tax=Gossypium barbadense TaxID=3634 RepID=A0A2P5WM11_GOSBA|nr:hypothetical protein GOBAR_AA28547 [Gossypium barbadense]